MHCVESVFFGDIVQVQPFAATSHAFTISYRVYLNPLNTCYYVLAIIIIIVIIIIICVIIFDTCVMSIILTLSFCTKSIMFEANIAWKLNH